MKLLLKKYLNNSAIVFTVFATMAVMYYYKNGGPRDFGLYANAGRAFLNGENAYMTQQWRSGSLGSVFIYLLSSLIPGAFLVAFFQIISFAGFWSLARVFQTKPKHFTWTLGFALFLSPVREVVNTLQITGLVSGLIALFLTIRTFKNKIKRIVFKTLQIFALALAVDLKPHSLIFVVLLLFLKNWRRLSILLAAGVSIIGHLIINLIHNRFLEKDWIDSLRNLGNASGSTGESTSIWKLFDYFSHSKINTGVISITLIIILTVLSFFLVGKSSNLDVALIGLLISTLMTYMHYYDLAPLAVVALAFFINEKRNLLGTTLFMFLILPREISNLNNMIVLLGIIVLIGAINLSDGETKQSFKSLYLNLFGSFLIFLSLHAFNSMMGLDYRMTHTLMTTETMILMWSYLLTKLNILEKLDLARISFLRRVQQ